MVKIGLCYNWKNYEAIKVAKQAGIEYLEAGFGSFWDCSDDEFKGLVSTLNEISLPCLNYNCMLPGDRLRVVGNNVSIEALKDYFLLLTDKLSVFDGRRVVFGSGGARAPRGEVSNDQAFLQITSYLKEVVAPIFKDRGWECVIEPLSECEVIKTIADGFRLVRETSEKQVRLLIDFYHAMANGEDVGNLTDYKGVLTHVHVASLNGRYYPKRGDGTDYELIFRALKDIDYQGNVSIEAKLKEGEDFNKAITEAFICLKDARLKVYGY